MNILNNLKPSCLPLVFINVSLFSLVHAIAILPELAVLPRPMKLGMAAGSFSLAADTILVTDSSSTDTARQLLDGLASATGFTLNLMTQPAEGKNAIILRKDPSLALLGDEGYRLTVTPNAIRISSAEQKGLFYGVQTLRQLLPPTGPAAPGAKASWNVPCMTIEDRPRFTWRGLLLDCSRTFQSIDYLKKTIDRMAFYKMNVLHLHLTDDQGWRIEIKKHPELTSKGARFATKYQEPESHQGFYTQVQMKELVVYASRRGVTLVPEIEMPGHSHAVLVCRPDLSCAGKVNDEIFPFFKGPGITEDILCAGNDNTFQFLTEVLDEVMAVFPSEFLHVGGDEAPKQSWQHCPKCQTRIKAEGLKNEHELQGYFIRRIEKHISAKGRRLLGWSEILEGGLASNAAVMDWIGGAGTATSAGHDVVMSPTTHCYFDYSYATISTERAYNFEPTAGLSPEQAKHVLGLQANFWSHIDREPQKVDQQLFPRLLAIAERGWSPAGSRDWPEFRQRIDTHLAWLSSMGIHYESRASARTEGGLDSNGEVIPSSPK